MKIRSSKAQHWQRHRSRARFWVPERGLSCREFRWKPLDNRPFVSFYLPLVDAYLQAGLDALADSTRMSIFQKLAAGPLAVNELAHTLPVSRPAVSQHLKVLKDAGLVMDRKAGTRRLYQLDPEGVARLRAHFDQMWTRALSAFQKVAEERPIGEDHGRHRRAQSKGA